MSEWFRARTPRVLLRRESLWAYSVPASPAQHLLLSDRTPQLISAGYAAYSDAGSVGEFEDSLMPVMATFRSTRSHLTAGFVSRSTSFDSALLREMIERCTGQGIRTVVEIRGQWSEATLELLLATQPHHLRIGPEYVQGVATLPEQFRRIVHLAEFANGNGIPLVARGVRTPEDLDALRVAGLGHFHQSESGDSSTDALDELVDALQRDREPTVLPFPLRPVR